MCPCILVPILALLASLKGWAAFTAAKDTWQAISLGGASGLALLGATGAFLKNFGFLGLLSAGIAGYFYWIKYFG